MKIKTQKTIKQLLKNTGKMKPKQFFVTLFLIVILLILNHFEVFNKNKKIEQTLSENKKIEQTLSENKKIEQKPDGNKKTAQINKITDGDTLKISYQGEIVTLRLYGIDAPEKNQAAGKNAQKYLDNSAQEKILFTVINKDQYGRTVAIVYDFNGNNINQALIENGWAWVYPQFCKIDICNNWIKAEKKARENKLGLWENKNPIPPWEWRKAKRLKNKKSEN